MRSHGKQAVLKDDEVDRIERAAGAACGTQTREEVIQSMYGRLDPKPQGASLLSTPFMNLLCFTLSHAKAFRIIAAHDCLFCMAYRAII